MPPPAPVFHTNESLIKSLMIELRIWPFRFNKVKKNYRGGSSTSKPRGGGRPRRSTPRPPWRSAFRSASDRSRPLRTMSDSNGSCSGRRQSPSASRMPQADGVPRASTEPAAPAVSPQERTSTGVPLFLHIHVYSMEYGKGTPTGSQINFKFFTNFQINLATPLEASVLFGGGFGTNT